ncbi:hypothetical protein NECAME_06447 [Necator americanus]|uniref:Uncharacterized protein n=1 Tax=Necator americanus TaxID=51031 RepID=W2TUP2_NECAM|nr:hypothetical protein NECAME_06447 [Necator americanus]ETN85359.1 hypothetical protein NECAME_06447 [Necator americanus]
MWQSIRTLALLFCSGKQIAGILIKVAATIVYLMVFPSENLLQDYSTVPLTTKSQCTSFITVFFRLAQEVDG